MRVLRDQLKRQISFLDCVIIAPRVFTKAGIPFVDYGKLDGINYSDMFVVTSDETKKTYLKIIQIDDHETKVEIVSQQQKVSDIAGKTVELVTGS